MLVAERALRGVAYGPVVARLVQFCGQRIGLLWNETLRDRSNIAYEYEMTQVREAAEWILTNRDIL